MPRHGTHLDLDRCPHCNVDRPSLATTGSAATANYLGGSKRYWKFYVCARCGGVVTASSESGWEHPIQHIYPAPTGVDPELPERAKHYLVQALNSLNSPSGAVMLAASAVDAMLKAKDYKTGSLYSRIDKAAEDHLITADMARWAHQVRLDANDERHADEDAPLPTDEDGKRVVAFAQSLGEFLFVLPSKVTRGIAIASGGKAAGSSAEPRKTIPPPNLRN